MLHLGSIGGTSIDVDLSFIFLIVLFAISSYDPNRGAAYALIWAPVLFVSILVHELAHAAMIAIFGYGASHVILGGIGGVTVNERRARPWHDMVISLVGPLSSFALAFLCAMIFRNVDYARRDPMLVVFLPLMVTAGILWGEFNLLPIPPLDGGRALRHLLRTFLSEKTAFVIAIWIAMVSGIAVAVWSAFIWREYFVTILLGWFTFTNYQQWADYRRGGFPGD